jgi:formylglycine-generating enzyme required for sulfatase activity
MPAISAFGEIVLFGSGGNQFSMEFVPIGDAGNAPDTTGNPNPAGAVAYDYNMGKFEVSRDMVTKANSAGRLNITLADLPGGNGVNRPATGVSWNEAARFVNWLNVSQGFSPAYKFATQPGDLNYLSNQNISLWTAGDAGFNAANPFRNSEARYFLPSVDEWYKAAYYDPNANGGAGGYWDYPTGSDLAPTAVASGTGADTAVYSQPFDMGPADITLAGGLSPYGTMGQGGNVSEWEETDYYDLFNDDGSSARGIRGDNWAINIFGSSDLLSSIRHGGGPTIENYSIGFRVASSVPEATPLLFGVAVMLGLWGWKKLEGERDGCIGNGVVSPKVLR